MMTSTAIVGRMDYNLQELEGMAQAMFESKFFGFTHKSQYITLMLMAQAKGRNPVLVVEDYHFFEGKASPKADAVLTWHLASGGDVEWIKNSPEEVEAIFTGPDRGPGLVRVTSRVKWTMEDARRANLAGKKNWMNGPEDMLTARVIGRGVKRVNPGCLRGERLVEERMDEPDDVLPQAPAGADMPVSPIIPRASEMAAQAPVEAVDAEHAPVAPEAPQESVPPTPDPHAAAHSQPAPQPTSRATKAVAPEAPPQPPANAIRLKETPTDIKEKAGPNPGGPIRYGLFFSIGVVGTFSKAAATKAALAHKEGRAIDIAFTSTEVPGPGGTKKNQHELVWIEGAPVEP